MNLAVTAIGRDRPGIVAAITSALLEAGGNVDDSQMSGVGFLAGLVVAVEALGRGAGPTHVLTVYGADRPGIVHDTAATLAELNVNITDLRTRRTGDASSPLYTLMVEIAVPDGVGPELDRALDGLRESKQLEARLSELESEVF